MRKLLIKPVTCHITTLDRGQNVEMSLGHNHQDQIVTYFTSDILAICRQNVLFVANDVKAVLLLVTDRNDVPTHNIEHISR